ncbi:hypothetical protein AB0A63_16610 [Lentzea sp. NPDC042327]|uniref:hypothetical protein n=1 Tax=Lentzea sp. NPDC042327 TaxID=3154801 RepID=UPI0033EA2121
MLRLALVVVLLLVGVPAHALPLNTECRVPAVHDPEVVREVHAAGLALRVSDKVMLAGFEAGWVESHMHNLDCGDADSLGVFQQRPSMGWGTPEQIMDVTYAATRFFEAAVRLDRPDLTPGLLADAVQRSCCPERYDLAVDRATSMLRQAWQGGPEVTDVVYVVDDGDVWAGPQQLSTTADFVGRPSVAGKLVYARTVRGEVMVLNGTWRPLASGVAGDPEAVLLPDGSVAVFAVLADGSVAKLSDLPATMGVGASDPPEGGQAGSIPLSAAGFAAGKPSAVVHPDGSVTVYVRSGGALMAHTAGVWREIAGGLTGSPEVVLRPDGTIAAHTLLDGRVHRLGPTWEPLGDGRFIDTVAALPDGAVYARKADGTVVKVG